MDLTPEERRKIYEEEKARIEAGQPPDKEKTTTSQETSTGLAPNIAGLLCYLGAWVTGIIFFVLEQKNRWVRFHAAQSIVVFGALFIASLVLGWIPVIGPVFKFVLGITGFVLWILLMVKAYNGESYRIAVAADLAEAMVGSPGKVPDYQAPPPPAEKKEATPAPTPVMVAPAPVPAAPGRTDEKIEKKVDDFFKHRREGRITASAFAIAWSIILLVVFNFFNQYIAYYHGTTAGGIVSWTRDPFFTSDIKLWLPILNTALAVAIIGHIIKIIVDKNLLNQAINIIIDGFGMAAVVTLLIVFPFDFSMIPNDAAAAGTDLGVHVVLIFISIGYGISLFVRIIKLLISIIKAAVKTPNAV
jgi:uncharacterized membrane protein